MRQRAESPAARHFPSSATAQDPAPHCADRRREPAQCTAQGAERAIVALSRNAGQARPRFAGVFGKLAAVGRRLPHFRVRVAEQRDVVG